MRKSLFLSLSLAILFSVFSLGSVLGAERVTVPPPPTGADKLPDYAVDSVIWVPVAPKCFDANPLDTRFPCSTKEGAAASGPIALPNNSGIIMTCDAPYLFQDMPAGTKAQYASLYGVVGLEASEYPYSILPDLFDPLMKRLGEGNWIPVGMRAVGLTGSETDISTFVNLSGKPIAPGSLGLVESYGCYWGYYSSKDGLTGDEIGSVVAAQIKMMVYESKPAIKAWAETPKGELPYAKLNPKNCASIKGTKQNEITYCDVVNIHAFITYDGVNWIPALFGAYNKKTGYEDLTEYLKPAPPLPTDIIPATATPAP